MPPVELEPTISAGERPQTYALDRAATGTGTTSHIRPKTEQGPGTLNDGALCGIHYRLHD